MSFFDNLFSWIGKIFSKIWASFKKVLPYIMAAAALYVGFVGALPLTYLGIATSIPAGWMSALFLAGASYLVAPEETRGLVAKAVTAIGDSVAVAAAVVGTTAGTAISSFASASGISSYLVIGGVALLAYMMLKRDGNATVNSNDPPRLSQGTPRDGLGKELSVYAS